MTRRARFIFSALTGLSLAFLVGTVFLARLSMSSGPDLWLSTAHGWWRVGVRLMAIDVTRVHAARPAPGATSHWTLTPGPPRWVERPVAFHDPDASWFAGLGDAWHGRILDDRTGAPADVYQIVVHLAVPFALSLFLPAIALSRLIRWFMRRRQRNLRGFAVLPAARSGA